ncbi:MAG: M23 family metallopeptidase [Desulfobacterales bacterium]|nr:M23 family metallopeptidase [Desulfobacterales bacterium]
MNLKRVSSLSKPRFTENLIRENALDENGFKEWLFYPGMLFNAVEKWWGNYGKRDKPHEGLDLCLYRDHRGNRGQLDEKTKIPAIYGGTVVGIINDFLGKSVIIDHYLTDSDHNSFCTIYGHIKPRKRLQNGQMVREGEIIATLAGLHNSLVTIFPHLHISLGWAAKLISYDKLNWKSIGAPNTLTLMNPLCVLGWQYRKLNGISYAP